MLDAAQRHAEWLVKLTDEWCWKAIAQGIGNRVWRSEAQQTEWPDTRVTYQFAILRPGDPPPGAGVIIGPFSA